MSSRPVELEQRREPVQERGRQRVEAILEAVQVLVESEGVDAVTTHRIAEYAGIPVGSVYQYFPNKFAIFGAHVQAFHDKLNAIYDEGDRLAAQGVPGFERLDWVLESLVDLWSVQQPLASLWEAVRKVPEMQRTMAEQNRRGVEYNIKWLKRAYPHLPQERYETIARVTHRTIESMLVLANTGTKEDRRRVTEELKTLIKAYFASIAAEDDAREAK